MTANDGETIDLLLDWVDDAEDAVREHYSGWRGQELGEGTARENGSNNGGDHVPTRGKPGNFSLDMAMLQLPPEQPAEEFAVEYDADPDAQTAWGKSVQSLPPVATLASAENLCRTHQVGADLLDACTLKLRHRLDNRGLLIPISKEES